MIVTGQAVRPWGGLRDDAGLLAVADEADLLFVGMGAEIGIATGKMHARGPVGAEQLTSFKYRVHGSGQTRP
mgnify:CR=1 FL=1